LGGKNLNILLSVKKTICSTPKTVDSTKSTPMGSLTESSTCWHEQDGSESPDRRYRRVKKPEGSTRIGTEKGKAQISCFLVSPWGM